MKKIDKLKQRIMQTLQAGRLAETAQLLEQARAQAPRAPDLLRLSAQVSGQLGQFERTAHFCEQLLELQPQDATAWTFLGNARVAAGDCQAALEAFDKAVVLAPDQPMVLINRGNALFMLGRYDEVIACLQRALQLAPDAANAHFNLGRAYKMKGDFQCAVACFEQALRLEPELKDAYIHLAGTLGELGYLDKAERVALDGLRRLPQALELHNCLAHQYRFRGDYDRALEECGLVLRRVPGDPHALGLKADLLERKGLFNEAWEVLRDLVGQDRLTVSGAEVYAKLCHRFDDCENAVAAIERALARERVDEGRRALLFALGKVLNRMQRYGEAFERYQQANRVVRANYDLADTARQFEALRELFTCEFLQKAPRAGNASERPVFVVGMPRSGTSLVEQILSSHPEVHGAGELEDMNRLAQLTCARARSNQPYPQCLGAADAGVLDGIAADYLSVLERLAPDAARVVDKMPHNFRHLGLIALLFPKARIIHCRRDPRDTCLSIFFQSFNQTHAYGAELDTLGKYYREYEKLMAHWREVIDLPFYEIHYADMVADQERYSRELVAFCGLEWDDRCLEFYKAERSVATASYDQVRRPIYKSSLERWRRYEPYIQPLLDALGDVV